MKKQISALAVACLLFVSVVPAQKASADAGITLGILGTVLGGTALASHLFGCHGGCGNSAPQAVFYPVGGAGFSPMAAGGGCCAGPAVDPCAVNMCPPTYPAMVPPPQAMMPQQSAPMGYMGAPGPVIYNIIGGLPAAMPQQQYYAPQQRSDYSRGAIRSYSRGTAVRGLW